MYNTLTIDRIEGGLAVCEYTNDNGQYGYIDIDIKQIDTNAAEGDIIVFNDKLNKYTVDKVKTNNRKKHMQNLFKNL